MNNKKVESKARLSAVELTKQLRKIDFNKLSYEQNESLELDCNALIFAITKTNNNETGYAKVAAKKVLQTFQKIEFEKLSRREDYDLSTKINFAYSRIAYKYPQKEEKTNNK